MMNSRTVLFMFLMLARLTLAETNVLNKELVSFVPEEGRLYYSLNLYDISTPDFSWPISLNYASDGFRPFEYSFPAGRGVSLTCSGVITREVVDLADDLEYVSVSSGSYMNFIYKGGMLAYYRADSSFITDRSSDIYSFAFGQYSGQFVITGANEVKIISGDFVEVDLSGMQLQLNGIGEGTRQDISTLTPRPSSITIKTLDGYSYIFGGELSSLEYSGLIKQEGTQRPNITSWYLSRIVAPNGQNMLFHYQAVSVDTTLFRYDKDFYWTKVDGMPLNTSCSSDTLSLVHSNQYTIRCGYEYLTKYALLKAITLPNTGLRVNFNYQMERNSVYPQENCFHTAKYADLLQPFLSEIDVSVGDVELAHWNMQYQSIDFPWGNSRYLSQAIDIMNNAYSYEYNLNGTEDLTSPFDQDGKLDDFGYYSDNPQLGLLQSHVNPLGRRCEYDYSILCPDSVCLPFIQNDSRCRMVFVKPLHRLAHTIVLREMRTLDGSQMLFRKHLNYGDTEVSERMVPAAAGIGPFINMNSNSGILLMPQVVTTYNSPATYSRPTAFPSHAVPTYPVCFREVTESGYNQENQRQYKNVYRYQPICTEGFYFDANSEIHPDEYFILLSYVSNWNGFVRSMEYYNQNNLIRVESSCYSDILGSDGRLYYMDMSGMQFPARHYACVEKKNTEYGTDGNCVQKSQYKYDNLFRKRREDTYNLEDHRFVKYAYLDDFWQSTDSAPCTSLGLCWQERNRRYEPILTTSGFCRDSIDYITASVLVKYTIDSSENIERCLMNLSISSPVENILPPFINGNTLSFDNRFCLTQTETFNPLFRLIRTQKRTEAIPTEFSWNIDGLYPISKTIGNQTWQYTYLPFVGIQSELSPRGIQTFYTYDALGRLLETYVMNNGSKEIIEKYDYK